MNESQSQKKKRLAKEFNEKRIAEIAERDNPAPKVQLRNQRRMGIRGGGLGSAASAFAIMVAMNQSRIKEEKQ